MRSDKVVSRILIILEIVALVVVAALCVAKLVVPKETASYELVERDTDSVNSIGITDTSADDNAKAAEMTEKEESTEVVSEITVGPQKAGSQTKAPVAKAAESDDNSNVEEETTSDAVIDMTYRQEIEISDEARALLETMSTEQKVAQLFLVSPETLTGVSRVGNAGSKTAAAISKYPVAGVVYSPSNMKDANQCTTLVATTQKLFTENAPLEMIIGAVSAFGNQELALSTSTGGDGVVRVITSKKLEDIGEDGVIPEPYDEFNDEETVLLVSQFEGLNVATKIGIDSVSAILKDADLIYLSEGFNACYEDVLAAVDSGDITKEALDEIVLRILTVKLNMPRVETTIVPAPAASKPAANKPSTTTQTTPANTQAATGNGTNAANGAASNGTKEQPKITQEQIDAILEYQRIVDEMKKASGNQPQTAPAAKPSGQ